jgi:nucleotide-binding universal stress UspA family protein
MSNFNNILVVVVDERPLGENVAVARALALAENHQAQLTLMQVISPPAHALSQYQGIIEPNAFLDMLVKESEQRMADFVAKQQANVDITIKVAVGRDFIEIVRQVVFAKHDLLIKVALDHPDSFHSSDFHLMRKCPQPVWLLKPSDQGRPKKILATVDLASENEQEGKELNHLIMNLATTLASWQNSELYLLSCWSLYGENTLRSGGFIKVSNEQLSQLLNDEQQCNHQRQLALLEQFHQFDINAHLIKGEPVEIIPAFVKEHAIDTVVMGTVGRSGIPGLLIGNTAETILHAIDASVVTLKPSGFVSPIK